MQSNALVKERPWIQAVANEPDVLIRRFEPQWDKFEELWVVQLCPAFECRVSDRSEISTTTRGIYRYLRGDEIVYIGRGQVRSRARAPERDQWNFETIEYSIVADDAQQAKWEAHWLDAHVRRHGRLPFYNRIGGTKPKSDSHSSEK
jgi:hypothetical protein